MSHQVLQRLRIHACFSLITTVSMSAHMWRDVWHLYSVNVIVSFYHVVKSVLPVQCYKWFPFLVVKEKSAVSINDFLYSRCFSIFNDGFDILSSLFFLTKSCTSIPRSFTFRKFCTSSDSILRPLFEIAIKRL